MESIHIFSSYFVWVPRSCFSHLRFTAFSTVTTSCPCSLPMGNPRGKVCDHCTHRAMNTYKYACTSMYSNNKAYGTVSNSRVAPFCWLLQPTYSSVSDPSFLSSLVNFCLISICFPVFSTLVLLGLISLLCARNCTPMIHAAEESLVSSRWISDRFLLFPNLSLQTNLIVFSGNLGYVRRKYFGFYSTDISFWDLCHLQQGQIASLELFFFFYPSLSE